MKKLIIRIYTELYHWHNSNFSKEQLPALTALLILSILQFFNIISIMMIVENIFSINISNFFSDNLAIGMIIPVSLLIMDYLIVRPIDVTIKENPRRKRTITWIYVLGTLLVLALCVVWIIYINESKQRS